MKLTAMSLNIKLHALAEGRWPAVLDLVNNVRPDLLQLQEADLLADPDDAEKTKRALGLKLTVAPSRQLNTAVAWNPKALDWLDTDTRYSTTDLHHGYCAPRFKPRTDQEWPVPLVAISTHLTPFAAETAAAEAKVVIHRAYRYGGIGLIGGDINHLPLGDPEPDWEQVPPYDRVARCLPRERPDDPWLGNRIVGQTFLNGDMTDIAAHLAARDNNPELLRVTGEFGQIRTDQTHVTPALVPAIQDYQLVDPGGCTDHWGTVCTLDLARTDFSKTHVHP
ncbi:hypothetical protein OG241_06465 [Streptomyces sp. NBC_01390]|uniref:hypothetical protein n=1 Tax=Streptomyces sp. NBC_01390 TaxID=2903850 RepID=UPI003251E8A8